MILFIHNFIFGLDFGLGLKKLASASALTSKPWPRSRPQDPGLSLSLGLNILTSFNITDAFTDYQAVYRTFKLFCFLLFVNFFRLFHAVG